MIVTEVEAVTKWCPQTRVAFMGEVGNRISSERLRAAKAEADRTGDDRDWKFYISRMQDTHCIGSLCMMWREAGDKSVSETGNPPYKRIPRPGMGYCGLAAKL